MINQHDLPNNVSENLIKEWKRFINILYFLRSEAGCPWDKEQTLSSLRPHIIEEPTELLEAIALHLNNPSEHTHKEVQEEMGDVLLVITMMMLIYDQTEKEHSFYKILYNVNEKLIRRHPHVFSNVKIETHEQLSTQWSKIKKDVEGKTKQSLDNHKNYMHVLERTKEVQKRLAKDYNTLNEDINTKHDKVVNILQNLQKLYTSIPENKYSPTPDVIEKTVGELLFSIVDISRVLKVSPTSALSRSLVEAITRTQTDIT